MAAIRHHGPLILYMGTPLAKGGMGQLRGFEKIAI
jgi:hypothetical protein